MTCSQHLPQLDQLSELPDAEIGLALLRHISDLDQIFMCRGNVFSNIAQHHAGGSEKETLRALIAEGWQWLESERLIAWAGNEMNQDSYVITRRGRRALEEDDPLRSIEAENLVASRLHPRLTRRIRNQFLVGECELAAFAAIREVEIRVRELGGFDDSFIGVPLMRAAFNPTGGPLRDPDLDSGEAEQTSALFAGAIGVFKNPSSHRQVEFDDPIEASEVILLADLLLRMLDEKAAKIGLGR
ncbi:MAG: TIGR02391 family protein [Acidobacteria bacterium]|nr:MAG: TIGR02391 family protein [Acidobacteriota bacterium]